MYLCNQFDIVFDVFCSNTHEIWQETFSGIKSGDLRMFVSVDRYNLTQSNMSPFYVSIQRTKNSKKILYNEFLDNLLGLHRY